MPLLSDVRDPVDQVMPPPQSLGCGFRLPTGQQTLPEVGVLGKARTLPGKHAKLPSWGSPSVEDSCLETVIQLFPLCYCCF